MDTLRDRLAELADDAPTGGAPAAELWARGKRVHRLRAAALAATLLVVGAGIGVRLADGDGNRSSLASGGTAGVALPIEYPAGQQLPDLGNTPGPLAAVWLAPRVGGGAPQAVGLVAKTGTFGTLPIDLPDDDPQAPLNVVALSPDGRRIAYLTPTRELRVRDLVSGENYSPLSEFQTRVGFTWIDATHLLGHVAGAGDVDGWLWEPGTAPKLVNPLTYPGSPWLWSRQGGRDPWFHEQDVGSPCSSPTVDASGSPVLCEVFGVIGSEIVLTRWGSEVVALDRADSPFKDPSVRHVVVTAGAPERVSFAADLIGEALDAAGGAS